MFLYFGSASSFFMKSIHTFWFVAVCAADRIAISPLYPICWASSCTSVRAFSPPLSAEVKYGLLTCLGRNPTVRPFLRAALGSALAVEAAAASSLLELFLVVPPQAVAASAREVTAARAAQVRRIDDL